MRGVWCQALSLPRPPVLWGGRPGFRGPLRGSRARFLWAWGPRIDPTACALASCRCALWGWREGVTAGAALRRCEKRLSSGTLPPPAARPLSGLSGSAAHVLWARVCRRGCATRPWGGPPGLGACGVCGGCAVFVCWCVRGGAVCAVESWCGVLPPFACLPGACLPSATSWCCACRGLWPCPLPRLRPSLGCWLPSFLLLCCGALYPFLHSPLARPPPWRAFFPASALVIVSVFSFDYFLVLGVLLLLSFLVLWDKRRMGVWAIAGVAVPTMTLLRPRCLLTWFVCVWRCRGFSPYHLFGVGDL